MNMATIVVSGVYAHARMYSTIPAGIVGATVTFEFTDPIWEELTKTAVFQGAETRDVLLTGNTAIIPAETVAKAGPMLKVGIYGVDAENNLVIPTLWAAIGGIRDAVDPSGDPGTDPELPIWAQLADRVEGIAKDVKDLQQTGGAGPGGSVAYDEAQNLTEEQKAQARKNIGAQPAGNYLERTELPTAINTALAQAKESGEFNGKDGKDGADGQPGKDGYTPQKNVDYFDGKDGKDGQPGADGKDYVLTPDDKTEIAEMAADLLDVPSDEHINGLINAALGVIENGTY